MLKLETGTEPKQAFIRKYICLPYIAGGNECLDKWGLPENGKKKKKNLWQTYPFKTI
jgi:hypothetical protein